ncbi:MAG: hypothetical protein PVI92_12585, partial [Chromatiales bacterium]
MSYKTAERISETATSKVSVLGLRPWQRIALLVASCIYLVFELKFNATLLDVAGGFSEGGGLEAVEDFGRTVSGIGFVLLTITALAADGWQLANHTTRAIAAAVVGLSVWALTLGEPARNELVIVGLGAAVLLLAAWLRRPKGLKTALVLCGITAVAFPGMFVGQKNAIEQYIIAPSSGEERLAAKYINLMKAGLRHGIIEIAGAPVRFEQLDAPEEKTFIALLGGLAWLAPDLTEVARRSRDQIADVMTDMTIRRKLDDWFKDYVAKREQFISDYWVPYEQGGREYAEARNSGTQRAERLWPLVGEEVDKGWRAYNDYSRLFEEKLNKDAIYVADRLSTVLKSYNRCHKKRKKSRALECAKKVEDRFYTRERKVHETVGQASKLFDWCSERDANEEETFKRITSALLSYGLSEVVRPETTYYSCDFSHDMVKDRMRDYRQDRFQKKSGGYPANLTRNEFRTHPITQRKVRERVARKGLDLPSTWEINDYHGFVHAVSAEVRKQADTRWRSEVIAKTGGYMEPGLSFEQFNRHPLVKDKFKERMGDRYTELFDFTITDRKRFSERVVRPNVEARIDRKIADLSASAQTYEDEGENAENGKNAIRAALIPPISLFLSLFFTVVTSVKNGIGVAVMVLPERRPWVRRSVMAGLYAMAVAAIVAPPFLVENRFSESLFYRHFAERFHEIAGAGAYSAEWIIRMQPIIYPLGKTLADQLVTTQAAAQALPPSARPVSNGAGSEVSLHARIDRFAMNKSEAELMSIQRSLKQLGH